MTDSWGTRWYRDGVLHRDDDEPAAIWISGARQWYRDGLLHRDNDKPAVTRANGSQEWWRHGQRHRDDDKPAVIADGTQMWYRNGLLHRDDNKPAGASNSSGEMELNTKATQTQSVFYYGLGFWLSQSTCCAASMSAMSASSYGSMMQVVILPSAIFMTWTRSVVQPSLSAIR